MLRSLVRSPRSVRVPLQNGTVDLQRVAITRKSKSNPVLYRIFTTVAVTYFVARTINSIYPDSAHGSSPSTGSVGSVQKSEQPAKAWSEQSDRANNSVPQNDSEAIKLMLPLWIRKQKPQRWQSDDPTWRAYRDLQADPKRMQEITAVVKKSLVKTISTKYMGYLIDIGMVSKGPSKLVMRDSWRLAPPLYAPATYEVPCIFVEPGKTSYGWHPLPNNIGAKMDHIFHPVAFARAFFFGVREFTWASYLITKVRLLDRFKISHANESEESFPPVTATADQKAQQQLALGRIPEEKKGMFLPFLRGEFGEHESRRQYRDLVKSMTYKGAIESGCAVFQAAWMHNQVKSMQSLGRESLILRGEITLLGDKGALYMNVVAVYSPDTDGLIGHPIIKEVYLSPATKLRDRQGASTPTARPYLPRDAGKQRPKIASADPLKPPPQQQQPPESETSADEKQEENREK